MHLRAWLVCTGEVPREAGYLAPRMVGSVGEVVMPREAGYLAPRR